MLAQTNTYIHLVLGSLLFFTSLMLIFLVLIQRGRGGGLAGALGGSGGTSAFGAKAGDTFTKLTSGLAVFWFVLCVATILIVQGPKQTEAPKTTPTIGASSEKGSTDVAPTGESEKAPAASDKSPSGESTKTEETAGPEKPADDAAKTDKPAAAKKEDVKAEDTKKADTEKKESADASKKSGTEKK